MSFDLICSRLPIRFIFLTFASSFHCLFAILSLHNKGHVAFHFISFIKTTSFSPYQVSIGRQWKELLDYKDTIGFIVHVSAFSFLSFFFLGVMFGQNKFVGSSLLTLLSQDDAKKHDKVAKNRYTV